MAKNVQLKNLTNDELVLHPETSVEQVVGLQDTLDSLASGGDLTALGGRVTTLEDTTIPNLKTELEGKIEGVQSDLIDYIDDVKESILGEDISEAFDTLKEVEEWITTHGNQAAGILEDLNGHQTALEGHQTAIVGLQGAVEGEISGLQTRLEGVQNQLTGVQDTIEETISGVQTDLDGVQSAAAGVQTQFTGVQTTLEASIANLLEQINGLQNRIITLETAPKSNVKAVDIA